MRLYVLYGTLSWFSDAAMAFVNCNGPNSGNGERVLPFKTQSCDAVEDIADSGAW